MNSELSNWLKAAQISESVLWKVSNAGFYKKDFGRIQQIDFGYFFQKPFLRKLSIVWIKTKTSSSSSSGLNIFSNFPIDKM